MKSQHTGPSVTPAHEVVVVNGLGFRHIEATQQETAREAFGLTGDLYVIALDGVRPHPIGVMVPAATSLFLLTPETLGMLAGTVAVIAEALPADQRETFVATRREAIDRYERGDDDYSAGQTAETEADGFLSDLMSEVVDEVIDKFESAGFDVSNIGPTTGAGAVLVAKLKDGPEEEDRDTADTQEQDDDLARAVFRGDVDPEEIARRKSAMDEMLRDSLRRGRATCDPMCEHAPDGGNHPVHSSEA